jgi:hypothetical protein
MNGSRDKVQGVEVKFRLDKDFHGTLDFRIVFNCGPDPPFLVIITNGNFLFQQLLDLLFKIIEVFFVVMGKLMLEGLEFLFGKIVIFLLPDITNTSTGGMLS